MRSGSSAAPGSRARCACRREEQRPQAHGGRAAGRGHQHAHATSRTSSTSRSWPSCCAGSAATVEHDPRGAASSRSASPPCPTTAPTTTSSGAMRASICVLGPLVARCGVADVALPGGDAIGSRGLDMHVDRAAAARRRRCTSSTASSWPRRPSGLIGAHVRLDFPSVGATENLLMAAVLARGTTVIDNAAREPEIVDLCRDAAPDGRAHRRASATSTLTIEGVAAAAPGRAPGRPRPDRRRHLGLRRRHDRRRHRRAQRRARATSAWRSTRSRPPARPSSHLPDGFRVQGPRRAAGGGRRHPAVPRLPDRPAALHDRPRRRRRGRRDGHREPVRGAVQVRPGDRAARRRRPRRRPPRAGAGRPAAVGCAGRGQ